MTCNTNPLQEPKEQTFASEMEDFESLLENFERTQGSLKPGDTVQGSVLSIKDNFIFLDIEYKSEGKIPLEQLKNEEIYKSLEKGTILEAVVEHMEDNEGYIILSYEKIGKKKLFDELENKFCCGETIQGTIIGAVKGGLMVDIGVRAFLPGSQIDLYPVRNLQEMIGEELDLKIIQYNQRRRNIVVSRRAILESEIDKVRKQTVEQLIPGNIVEGIVKNITDYGIFVDLGGVDGLLHKTDISWGRVQHPADFFQIGLRTPVIILSFDPENMKVSLGYKQMESDPWKGADAKYPPETVIEGRISSVTSYGLFIEIEKGIEGLVHRSEISWDSAHNIPAHQFQPEALVKVMVLNIDVHSRRLSLSIKRTQPNPWYKFSQVYKKGNIIQGKVCNINKYGLFLEVNPSIVGRVFPSDISWKHDIHEAVNLYRLGDTVNTVILDLDSNRQKLTLGVKQLEEDIWDLYFSKHQVGDVVEGSITSVLGFGAFVHLDDGIEGLCHISEYSTQPIESPDEGFCLGQQVKMRIIKMNLSEKKIALSHKEVGEAMTQDQQDS